MKLVREALQKIRAAHTGLLFAATAVGALAANGATPEPLEPFQASAEAPPSPENGASPPKPSSARASAQEATGGLREAAFRLHRLTSS